MLYRMITRWAETNKFKVKLLDWLDGDAAGLKSATITVEGPHAYGFLKSENGVHRLVRVSPFDAQGRRQTSFASIEVMPEFPDLDEIQLRDEDYEFVPFHSSGAGGQNINKVSSAVRITHLPSGLVVQSQDQKSQLQNKEKAFRLLRSKLYDMELERRQNEEAAERRSQIGTGDRSEKIRTYNFPQGRVTDHRIKLTLYKIDAIMDGDIQELIDSLIAADQAAKLAKMNEN